MALVTFTLNSRILQAEAGRMLLPVALENGIHIPHYCYHPGLSIAGNCRMCLVEIEGVPKLQTACSTAVREGMAARSDTERVKKAVQHVLEFLLINHPVDCPVCDQAGECGLQEYYMSVGRHDSRFAEDKVTKPRKAAPIGRWIVLDQERCILCSRCVRFTREVSRTGDLAIFNRGDHAEVDVMPGKTLSGRYTGNLADVCPVGALTCRDFRFKCRVWYLRRTPSICTGCARGCNVEIHTNPDRPQHGEARRVMRLKPRPNPDVNGHWLCDDGRYGYGFLDEDRLAHAAIRSDTGLQPVRLREAIDLLGQWVEETDREHLLYVLSPKASNEELFAVRKLFAETLKAVCVLPSAGMKTGDADDLLVHEDKHPNSRGAMEIFSFLEDELLSEEALAGLIREKGTRLLVLDRCELPDGLPGELAAAGCRLAWVGTNRSRTAEAADLVIPAAVHAEQDGSFVNAAGLIQHFRKALDPLGESEPEWALWSRLARRLGCRVNYNSARRAHLDLRKALPFFAG